MADSGGFSHPRRRQSARSPCAAALAGEKATQRRPERRRWPPWLLGVALVVHALLEALLVHRQRGHPPELVRGLVAAWRVRVRLVGELGAVGAGLQLSQLSNPAIGRAVGGGEARGGIDAISTVLTSDTDGSPRAREALRSRETLSSWRSLWTGDRARASSALICRCWMTMAVVWPAKSRPTSTTPAIAMFRLGRSAGAPGSLSLMSPPGLMRAASSRGGFASVARRSVGSDWAAWETPQY